MEVLSPQDGRTQIQGQTNISSATAADNKERVNLSQFQNCGLKINATLSKISKKPERNGWLVHMIVIAMFELCKDCERTEGACSD